MAPPQSIDGAYYLALRDYLTTNTALTGPIDWTFQSAAPAVVDTPVGSILFSRATPPAGEIDPWRTSQDVVLYLQLLSAEGDAGQLTMLDWRSEIQRLMTQLGQRGVGVTGLYNGIAVPVNAWTGIQPRQGSTVDMAIRVDENIPSGTARIVTYQLKMEYSGYLPRPLISG